jgi:hypothetical protein
MSSIALQRVIVRMLFDPKFTARVYENPILTLDEVELTDRERTWLIEVDPRAWRIDGARSHRALEGLLRRYPVSVALWVVDGERARELLAFFHSDLFHECIQQRGYLSEAFAHWLAETARADVSPWLKEMVGIETEIGRTHRGFKMFDRSLCSKNNASAHGELTDGAESRLHLPPWVALLRGARGADDIYGALIGHIEQRPQGRSSALEGLNRRPLPSPEGEVTLLIEATAEGAQVGEIPDGLATLLSRAGSSSEGAPLSALLSLISEAGLDPNEAPAVIDGLIADHLLH